MVLTFVVGLPTQGIAAAMSATASPVPWAADAEVPPPDDCYGYGDQAAMGTLCPTVFCIGLTAVVIENSEYANPSPDTLSLRFQNIGAGLSLSPDPFPPRTSVQA